MSATILTSSLQQTYLVNSFNIEIKGAASFIFIKNDNALSSYSGTFSINTTTLIISDYKTLLGSNSLEIIASPEDSKDLIVNLIL